MTNSSGDPVHTPHAAGQGSGGSGPWVIAGLVAVVAIIAVAFMVIGRDQDVTSEDLRTVAEQSRLQGMVEGAQAGADSATLSAQMAGDRVARMPATPPRTLGKTPPGPSPHRLHPCQ
jgi:hypothetical protein